VAHQASACGSTLVVEPQASGEAIVKAELNGKAELAGVPAATRVVDAKAYKEPPHAAFIRLTPSPINSIAATNPLLERNNA
jgi:hypothetical protein